MAEDKGDYLEFLEKVAPAIEFLTTNLTDHIYKEDNILYPMADEALNEKTQKSMLEKFKKLEKNKEKYLSVLKYFEKRK